MQYLLALHCNNDDVELKTVHPRREVVFKPAEVVGEKYVRPAGKSPRLQMSSKPVQHSECSASEQVHITFGDTFENNPSILISFASANMLSGVHFGPSPEDLSTYYAAEAKTFSTLDYFVGYLFQPNLGVPDASVEQLALELDTTSFGRSPFD